MDGEAAELLIARDEKSGFEVHISSFGATIVRIKIPDKSGNIEDIVYGQHSPTEYLKHRGYLGAVVGRVANRIGNACFDLDGEHYELQINNANKHTLHGGERGLSYRLWEIIEPHKSDEEDKTSIMMEYKSKDGEEGFPGDLTVRVTYTIKPMEIGWEFFAFTNKKTIINLTNHSYWNLDGLFKPINNQILTMDATHYNPVDDDCFPTTEILPVKGTPIDFHEGRTIGSVLNDFGDLDNNFFLAKQDTDAKTSKLKHACRLYSPQTHRVMNVWTTEPCVQVYSGNFMDKFQSFGKPCLKHSAICLETQKVPNAINLPDYRDSVILRPKEQYYQKTIHKFSLQ